MAVIPNGHSVLTAGIILGAVLLALLPVPPALVERWYSSLVYPAIQRVLTPFSNSAPFALFDALIAVSSGWLLLAAWRDWKRRPRVSWWRRTARVVWRAASVVALLYIGFLIAWGLNYRRVPLAAKVVFEPSTVTPARARNLALTTVDRLNALHDAAHRALASRRDAAALLEDGFARTTHDLGVARAIPTAQPKQSLLDPYFRAAGVDGMTDPYFLETLVASGPLPIERPFVIAHEWSHLAGFAHEGEANFVGWLAAVRGGPAAEYSAWLFLYGEIRGSLDQAARAEVAKRLADGPRADLDAIARRYRDQVKPWVSAAGWDVYDRYLRANRVEGGVTSYGDVVRLLLGTRFGPAWTPVMKPRPVNAGGPPPG